MELLPTDKDTFPTLVCTRPRNVLCKNEKYGLCDPFRASGDDHRDHEAWYALGFSHEQADEEMCQRLKKDDHSQQTRTLVPIYIGIKPIGGRIAKIYCPAWSRIALTQGMRLIRK